MAEIGFLCIIGALLVFIVVLEVIHVKERRTLMHAIIARNPGELRSLNRDVGPLPSLIERHEARQPVERTDDDDFWNEPGMERVGI